MSQKESECFTGLRGCQFTYQLLLTRESTASFTETSAIYSYLPSVREKSLAVNQVITLECKSGSWLCKSWVRTYTDHCLDLCQGPWVKQEVVRV